MTHQWQPSGKRPTIPAHRRLTMNTSWGSDEDAEIDDELVRDLPFLIPDRQRNYGDIGTRDYYDRVDRDSRRIGDGMK